MPQLVNAQTNTTEDISQDAMGHALQSGTHNLIKGAPVNVINPDGELVSLPSEQIPEALRSNFKIPSQQDITTYQNKQKYETPLEEAKTFGEGVGSGASFGTSRELENYVLNNQKEQAARKQINPNISTAGELTGAIGSALVAPELSPVGALGKVGAAVTESVAPAAEVAAKALANPETSPVVAKILASIGNTGSKALGSAVEGTAYGLGNAVSEHALGDADLNAENVLHNVGYGALFGGALGGALGIGEGAYSKVFGKEIKNAAAQDSIIENAATSSANPITSVPTSLEDIAKRVEAGRDLGFTEALPQKQALLDAEQTLAGESQFPSHSLQAQSLESPFLRDYYKTFLESGTPEAQNMQAYEAFQKKEGTKLVDKFIQDISPESKVTDDAVQGGNKLVDAFTDQYQEEKNSLKPFFKEFDDNAVTSLNDPDVIINKIDEAIPKASSFIHKTPEGFTIEKYSPTMPISKEAHGALKDLVGELNTGNLTIGGLRNLRETLRDSVNFLTAPRVAGEISSLRKSLMDVIQDEIQKASPDMEVRNAFRKYAINEQNRQTMEKILGGSISDKATFAKEIKPEDVLSKVFSNTISIKAAKDILGEDFNHAAANYLSQNVSKFTDAAKNGFSSNKFASLLKAKGPELEEALTTKPDQLNKLRAITDKMRILPDSPSVNPSGTAKTSLLQKMQSLGGMLTGHGLVQLPGQALQAVSKHLQGVGQRSTINDILAQSPHLSASEQLATKQSRYGALSAIERMGQSTTRKINSGARDIFSDVKSPIIGLSSEKMIPDTEKYQKIADKLKDLSTNFDKSVESLQESTKHLHSVAPGISESLNVAASRATQFLASKLPAQDSPSAFTEPYKPSSTELAIFNRYYSTVEKPLSILGQIKQGTLTKESVEALQTVYPKLYSQIQTAIMDQVSSKLAKNPNSVPYSTKLMLSMFTGSDMNNSLKPQNINSAQQVYAQQNQASPQKAASLSKINKGSQILTAEQKVQNGDQS